MNKKNRKEKLNEISKQNKTVILYEAPHKIKNTLQDLYTVLGNVNCVIARELTKIHEECIRGNLYDIMEKLKQPKGEFVIILDLNNNIKNIEENIKEATMDELYNMYLEQGLDKKEIIKRISKDKKLERNVVYQYFIKK